MDLHRLRVSVASLAHMEQMKCFTTSRIREARLYPTLLAIRIHEQY